MQLTTTDTNVVVDLPPSCFDKAFNETLVHQSVVAHLAGARSGTKAQKTRSAVSGGGAKPFKQKGSGRARAGSIRSPLWRGGGKIFAATPRDFSQKLNRKMYRAALRAILSELLRQERISLVGSFSVPSGRTQDAIATLGELPSRGRLLIIMDELDEMTMRSVRNIPRVDLIGVSQVNPANLVAADRVLLASGAVSKLEEWLA
jgi:large subunit ribosomal protein L4